MCIVLKGWLYFNIPPSADILAHRLEVFLRKPLVAIVPTTQLQTCFNWGAVPPHGCHVGTERVLGGNSIPIPHTCLKWALVLGQRPMQGLMGTVEYEITADVVGYESNAHFRTAHRLLLDQMWFHL